MTPARIAFVLTLLLAFGANAAEDAVLREAKSLMDARQPQQAYDLLKPLEEEAGNPDYDFLLGIAATDIGRNTEAIFALQRVVDQDPNHGPARAELARALMQANETDAARRELEILQEQDPPSDVKRVLEEYLAAIDRYHGAYRTTFARYVQTGMGFDTNVNNATDRGAVAVPGLGGLVFALTPDSRELDSTIWNLGAGFSFSAPLRDALRLVGGIDFDYDIALKDSDFTPPSSVCGGRITRRKAKPRVLSSAWKASTTASRPSRPTYSPVYSSRMRCVSSASIGFSPLTSKPLTTKRTTGISCAAVPIATAPHMQAINTLLKTDPIPLPRLPTFTIFYFRYKGLLYHPHILLT